MVYQRPDAPDTSNCMAKGRENTEVRQPDVPKLCKRIKMGSKATSDQIRLSLFHQHKNRAAIQTKHLVGLVHQAHIKQTSFDERLRHAEVSNRIYIYIYIYIHININTLTTRCGLRGRNVK